MSRRKITFVEDSAFIERFIEVCGTSEPAKVARLLNISYQAAKNYLAGRLPNPYVLRSISEITSYSIHWLLTGEGKKVTTEAPELPDEVRNFIRYSCAAYIPDEKREFVSNVCREIIFYISNQENFDKQEQETIFVLTSDKIKQEKVLEESQETLEKEI